MQKFSLVSQFAGSAHYFELNNPTIIETRIFLFQVCKWMKNYLKPKRQPHLMTDAINDQVFAWNKFVKLFLLVVSFLVNVTNWRALIFGIVSGS